jgi:hypothetical protein
MHSFRIIDWQKKPRQKVSTPPALSSCTHVIFEKSESPKKDFFAAQELKMLHDFSYSGSFNQVPYKYVIWLIFWTSPTSTPYP